MQMNATSSQDEFAKWAKLRRRSDKLGEEIEKCSMYTPILEAVMLFGDLEMDSLDAEVWQINIAS
jgi:hypothetical protein